eukprot:c17404_g2_i1 orf=2-232(-)
MTLIHWIHPCPQWFTADLASLLDLLPSHVRLVSIGCNLSTPCAATYAIAGGTYCACRLMWHVLIGFVQAIIGIESFL